MTKQLKQTFAILFILLAWTSIQSAQAAEFKWMDHQGNMHTLADLKGKPVLLHFWASWCPPCQAELPEFAAWINKHPDTQVIPVSLDNSMEEAAAFIASKHIIIPTLLTNPRQAQNMGIRGLPTTLIIAADGSITQRHLGPRDWKNEAFNQQIAKGLHP